jgi:hypothetical protein
VLLLSSLSWAAPLVAQAPRLTAFPTPNAIRLKLWPRATLCSEFLGEGAP